MVRPRRVLVLVLFLTSSAALAGDPPGITTVDFAAGVHAGAFVQVRDGEVFGARTLNAHEPTRYTGHTEIAEDGTHRAFDRDGHLLATYRVRDGRLDGPLEVFDPDGQRALATTFVAGVLDGAWREWTYETGTPVEAVVATYAGGKLEGEVTYDDRFRHEHGTLHFRGGKPDGTWTELGADRSTLRTYKDGRIDGPAETARSDGFTERGTLVGASDLDAQKEGTWEELKGGVLLSRSVYLHGLQDGPSVTLAGPRAGETLDFHHGAIEGWSAMQIDGVPARVLWKDSRIVAMDPRRAAYAWDPWGAEVAAGPMIGAHVSLDARATVTHAWGTAAASLDGQSARGWYVATGGEAALQTLGGEPAVGAVGPVAEVGWAHGGYDRASGLRDVRGYVRAVPYVTTDGKIGGRIALGTTHPRWPGRAWHDLIGTYTKGCSGRDCADQAAAQVAGVLAFPAAPLWLVNHAELTAEADGERGARLGVMFGYGR